MTSEITRIVQDRLPAAISYQATYKLNEGTKADVLNGAQNAQITFFFQSEAGTDVLASNNGASLSVAFGESQFRAGENVVMGSMLTFTNNGQSYTFYSNGVSIPMLALHTVTFDSNGGSEVAEQRVVDNENAVRPADPTLANHSFNGWMLDGREYNFASPVKGNITLTA